MIRKDLRTTEEVESSRCMRNRHRFKPCPCGAKAGKECSENPNMRVKRIRSAIEQGRVSEYIA